MANVMGQSLEKTESDLISMLEDIEVRKLVVDKFGFEWTDFITKKATEIINEEVVETIKWKMRMWKFSKKIIDSTYLDRVIVRGKGISAYIKSDYFSESGFNVSMAREKGTKRHFIQPISTGLTWYVSGGFNPKMVRQPQPKPTALHWSGGGKHFFSKGHWVSGIPSLKLIKKTIGEKKKIVKERLKEETIKWVEDLTK
jgi:hypothetical protein